MAVQPSVRPDPLDAGQPTYARQQEASAGAALVWAWLRRHYGVVTEFSLPSGVRAWHVQQHAPREPLELQFTIPALESAQASILSRLQQVAAHAASEGAAVEPDHYRVTSHGVSIMPGSPPGNRSPWGVLRRLSLPIARVMAAPMLA